MLTRNVLPDLNLLPYLNLILTFDIHPSLAWTLKALFLDNYSLNITGDIIFGKLLMFLRIIRKKTFF